MAWWNTDEARFLRKFENGFSFALMRFGLDNEKQSLAMKERAVILSLDRCPLLFLKKDQVNSPQSKDVKTAHDLGERQEDATVKDGVEKGGRSNINSCTVHPGFARETFLSTSR